MHTCPIYYPWCINNVSTFAQTCMYIQAYMFVDVNNNSLRPRDINPSQHRVHRQVLSMHISNKVRVHEPDVPWCTYMPALPSTLARVNRQPKRYAVLTITWMCHLHIHVSIDFNLTSWVQLCLCTFPTKVRCTYMPALPSSLAGVHVNRPYAVSLNISSHLLHDGMFKSTSCVQAALSTFTTKFHHVHTFYLSANACLNYRQPRPYP